MMYRPKIVVGKVKGTGYPIDGCSLLFSQWSYDPESWHLWDWGDCDDEAVMQTMFQTESEAGFCSCDTLEEFEIMWKAKEWESDGVFCLPLDNVEVLEVKQEESE